MKTLEAKKRDVATSLNTVRENGEAPAVIYGNDMETISVSVVENDLRAIWRDVKDTETFTLDVEGTSYTVIIKEIQTHPVTGKVLHVDFYVQA
jgi:large subunit ribosomal protein L25